MKTEQEITADVAQGVREAARERAEYQYAENLACKKEIEKEEKAKRKVSNEKLSSFYYKVSLLFLTGSGVSGLSPTILRDGSQTDWFQVGAGVLLSAFFAILANHVINK